MLTNSVGQQCRQGVMGTAYLCSMISEVPVEYLKAGGWDQLKAHLLTYQEIDAGCWLEGWFRLHLGLSM